MTKQQLIEAIAAGAQHDKKRVAEIMDSLLTAVTNAIAGGDRVDLRAFGSFVPKETKARQGRNPQAGEPIQIAAKKTVAFNAAKDLELRLGMQESAKAADAAE